MAIHSLPSADESTGDDIVAEINITPLTDIFLVLLIIFMVTTSVISSQGKNVDLPSSAVASQVPAGVTVTLSADDEVAIDGAVVKGDAIAPA
ncbi:MAG: biopolymer transporter ExbD, partial [Proteobacteria bacterium]|nr:biopolymer transporter ExbD [Pseudomonadota bacterium]